MSHCVNYTLRDIITHWGDDSDLGRISLLKDGASPVVGFSRAAEEVVEFARAKGVKITTTAKAFNTDDDE